MENNNSFWIIFDTCTRPEYYQDVHNILALPQDSIIRYSYNRKYFDDLSLLNIKDKKYPKDVFLVYGQFEEFRREIGYNNYNELRSSKSKYFIIPTRIAEIEGIVQINEEIYIELKLKGYPYPEKKQYIDEIILSISNSLPFNQPSKYIAISGRYSDFNFIKNSGNNKDNWSAIVKEFQNDKSQFKNDSFWRIDGPYFRDGKKINSTIASDVDETGDQNYQSFYKIIEGYDFYFNLYNYEPQGTNKTDLIKENKIDPLEVDNYSRKILIDDTNSPVISSLKKIDLRQYFFTKIKFQRNFNSELYTKEGACYFYTNGKLNEWPIGAEFYLYFKLKKQPWKLISGLILILVGVASLSWGNNIIKDCLSFGIILHIISTISFLSASYLLYWQLKTKI